MPPVPKLPGSGIPVATGDESLYKDSCRAPYRLHQYSVTTRTWADSVGPGMFEAGGQVFGEGGVIERAPIEPVLQAASSRTVSRTARAPCPPVCLSSADPIVSRSISAASTGSTRPPRLT